MTGPVLLAAMLAAVFAASVASVFVKPSRPLNARIRPYAHMSRTRLGRTADPTTFFLMDSVASGGVFARIFGPMYQSMADRFGQLIDAGGDEGLRLRLRQAGFYDTSPQQYRMRQLGYSATGFVAGGMVGILFKSPIASLICAGMGFVWGVTFWRGKVNRTVKQRVSTMKLEIYTVAHLLAMYVRSGQGLVQSAQSIVQRGTGPVVDELKDALNWMSSGMSQAEAYERLAVDTPEPTAARLYRSLAEGVRSGGDLGQALLSISDDLRAERREDVERDSTKRRGAMLMPTIVFMAPVIILFLLAPAPSMLMGQR